MNIKKFITILIVVPLTFISLNTDIQAKAKCKIVIAGSTTVLPIAQRSAELYMDVNSDANITVRGGGSGVGIAALIDGRCDIADASRSMKTKELKIARGKGVNPVGNIIATDGIAIVVNKSNPIKNITLEQLRDIYTGKTVNWKELGGNDAQIVSISRDYSSGTFEVFKKLVLKGDKVKNDVLMLASNKGVSTTVNQTKGALGYIGLGYISDDLKVLTVNSVYPTKENVSNNNYPIARPLFMYTNGKPKGLIKSFIDFILSDNGKKIVEETGYVPVQ
jgi:phosphate transport system substrate-binding protein